jgi:hypothetical protein
MRRCPRCGSQYIRASYSKKVLDKFIWWFLNRVPFRCRKCRLRFYRREQPQNTDYVKGTAAVRQVNRWT